MNALAVSKNTVFMCAENVKAKSLKTYIDEHPNLKGLRLSMLNYIDQGWMENLPLYAIEGYLRAEGIV